MDILNNPAHEWVDFSELQYARKHRPHIAAAYSWGTNADGELIWVDDLMLNILHDEGEQAILSAYFDTDLATFGAPPANLYMGLDARASLAEANTLASLSGEPSGNGYARQAIPTTTGFTLSQPGAYYQATPTTSTFGPATGSAWSAVLNRFLCTVSSGTSGKLIASLALTASRTLQVGDSLNTNLIIGLSEA
jgi:hypothetical protein